MKKAMKQIDEVLLLKIIENRADDYEKRLFERWIEASEMHVEAFEQLKKTYQVTRIDANKQKNWDAIAKKYADGVKVPEYIELPSKQNSKLRLLTNPLMQIAAVLVVLVCVSLFVKVVVLSPKQLTISGKDLKPFEAYQLADGSKVYLNGNSEITFSEDFGTSEREIELRGEAFFEVRKNKAIPFMISTLQTTVQVFGTSFNVYSDLSEKVKVSVVTGVVAFYSGEKGNGVTLTAGEQAAFDPSFAKITKAQNVDPNFLAWKTGVLYFKQTPITEALGVLQKQYSRVFVFDAKRASMPTLTTTIDNQTLDAVLEELNLLLNTKTVIKNDTIIFKQNN